MNEELRMSAVDAQQMWNEVWVGLKDAKQLIHEAQEINGAARQMQFESKQMKKDAQEILDKVMSMKDIITNKR